MEKETVILTCSSLERYVKRAQEKMHTNYPIIVIDRIYHVEPATMKTVIWQELEKRKRKPDTILAAMGFCGGVWDQVRAQVRTGFEGDAWDLDVADNENGKIIE